MPRPYSVDLRERALLACERDGGGCAEVARRFRIGASTLRLWRQQARDEGRRAPRPMGRGPAPLGGRLKTLARLAAERRDATLAEYADMLAARKWPAWTDARDSDQEAQDGRSRPGAPTVTPGRAGRLAAS